MTAIRRLAAILAADVAGYSRLMGAEEEGTHQRLQAHLRELVNPKVGEHRGRIVKNTGDGFLAEFASVVDAVRCAVEIQREMAECEPEVPDERRIRLRIGINLGDVIAEGDDIFGDGVNVAARLEALAEPAGICVSRVVHDQVRDKVGFGFEDLGEQQFKNITRPVHAYRIAVGAAKTLPLPDKPSLVVLPFQNMTGDVEQDYFVDGVVEEITTAISRLPWLFVIARNSAFTYKSRAVEVKQVARELGVRYVLEGSVRKSGNRVRITGQLIDTTTGAHIWADRFDGVLDDIFELQDEVAASVAGTIEPKLRQSEIERAIRKPIESLDAYDLHLRALAQLYKYTKSGMHEVIVLSRRALAVDPSYVPAAALIGWCRAFQRAQGWKPISDPEIIEIVRLARDAAEAGKDDPDTLWMAGWSLAYLGGEHSMAASIIDRALKLNPNSAHGWMVCGLISAHQYRPNEAIAAFQRAMRLSPLDPLGYVFATGLAFAYLAARQYEEAMGWVDRALRDLPRFVPAIRSKVVICAHLGRTDEARQWIERLLDSQPELRTISDYTKNAATYMAPEVIAVHAEGYRKAGLPEE